MRSQRIVLAAVLAVASSALTGAAGATVKKLVCLQVTDPAGDYKVGGQVEANSLDILSADIATGKRNLVAAIRLKTVDRDSFLAGGITYRFDWTVGTAKQRLLFWVYGTGETAAEYQPTAGTEGIVADARIDRATSTVTWTVPRKNVPTLKKAGAKLSALKVTVLAANNFKSPAGTGVDSRGTVGNNGDDATGTKVYADHTPSCLKGT